MGALNQQQRIAVTLDKPLVVAVSGPGSGKTRVLVERVKWMCGKSGFVPPRVVILTYTNAAAHEIRRRLSVMDTVEYVGTLHGWCYRLLNKFGHHIGYGRSRISILPPAERQRVLFDIRDRLGIKVADKTLITGVRNAQTDLIFNEYDFTLKRSGLVDYDRILKDAAALLNVDEVRNATQLDHLLVDECQDSAIIDWLIYEKIPAKHKFFVGDPDQAIFAFRGGYPNGFVEMSKHADEVILLEMNYRSDTEICDRANMLIEHNSSRVGKLSISVSECRGRVEVHGFENAYAELEDIAARIRDELQRSLESGCSMAVLCRLNFDARRCADYLREVGILVAEHVERELPRDWERVLLLLGILLNPANDILVEQFLRLEMGAIDVNRMKLRALSDGATLHQVAQKPSLPHTGTSGTASDWISRYLAANRVSDATVGLVRARNELLAANSDLSDLLADLHTHSEAPQRVEDSAGKVYVGTIHSAKGREWDMVFLPAFEQFAANAEEERRLAFVAITRARHAVFMSWAKTRKQAWGTVRNEPSQFIAEMKL